MTQLDGLGGHSVQHMQAGATSVQFSFIVSSVQFSSLRCSASLRRVTIYFLLFFFPVVLYVQYVRTGYYMNVYVRTMFVRRHRNQYELLPCTHVPLWVVRK